MRYCSSERPPSLLLFLLSVVDAHDHFSLIKGPRDDVRTDFLMSTWLMGVKGLSLTPDPSRRGSILSTSCQKKMMDFGYDSFVCQEEGPGCLPDLRDCAGM